MKRISTTFQIALAAAGGFLLLQAASAQTFTYTSNDLALGFRKTGSFQGNYEVVVNIGQANTYFNLGVGSTISVPGFTASQLTPGTFNNLSNLTWAVFGYYSGSGFGASYPSSVASTLWVTVPRANPAIRSADATRLTRGVQASVRSPIKSILDNAAFVASALGSSGTYNTATFVRESISDYPDHLLTVWMGSIVKPAIGTLNDSWPEGNLEITTPGDFTAAVRSDLYEVRPLFDAQGNPIVDPHTGTSGLAWYIGYFEFRPDGAMTFTREAASTTPPQVTLNIGRTNDVNTISFVSASSVTYALFFTNSAGLTAPVTSWPSLPGTISGDGTTKSFQDTTSDRMRFYRVQEQ
jgi:hypothetical protein